MYQKQIAQLSEKVRRRAELKALLSDLTEQKKKAEEEVFALRIKAHNEQADVDNLESFSVKNLFMKLTGKMEETLARETKESRDAKAQFDRAKFHLEHLKQQYEQAITEFQSLKGCEMEFWNALQTACASDPTVIPTLTHRIHEIIPELKDTSLLVIQALEMSDNVLDNLRNLRDGNATLNGTARELTLRGYLLGGQKKINSFRAVTAQISDMLSQHPVGEPLKQLAFPLFDLETDTLSEPMISKPEIDRRLLDAIHAVKAAKERLSEIGPLLNDSIEELNQRLLRYEQNT